MRGSVVGLTLVGRLSVQGWGTDGSLLAQDDTINDLARKYNVTMEAIALQTKHIVDEMNDKGHEIRSIFLSGGQSKNVGLMQLLANTCNMPVVIPHSSSAAVVSGAAMLGRLAAEARERGGEGKGKELWDVMVSDRVADRPEEGAAEYSLQVEMTTTGRMIPVSVGSREKKLLEAKYSIFREAIEIQKRWRKKMEDVVSEGG